MQLRPAYASDLASIEALLQASGLPTAGVAEHLTGFVVAVDDSRVVACGGAEYHGDFALIRSIAVAGHVRRSGLGKAILSRLLSDCRSDEVPSVVLLTTTAEGYFADNGFVRISRGEVPPLLLASGQFQGVCPASATTMLMVL